MTQPKTISRRAFLLLSGAAVSVAALSLRLPELLADSIFVAGPDLIVGRALRAAPVYAQAADRAAIVGRVWPDSMLPIRDQVGDWYAVDEGYCRCTDLQPMLVYAPTLALPVDNLPAAVTVSGPVAVVRRWVGAQAPLVTRVGYGGVLWAVDRLADDSDQIWYGVAEGQQEAPLGWTRAALWSAVLPTAPRVQQVDRELVLDRRQRLVTARAGNQMVFSAPVVAPAQAQPHRTALDKRAMIGRSGDYAGVPWCLAAADTMIHGAYWHNAFGKTADRAGWEVSPWAARWLYDWLPDGALVSTV